MNSLGSLQAKLQVLHKGKTKTVTVTLSLPARLIPVQGGRPPSYFIIAGLVFLQATVPYLRSEYGKDFDFEAPVKLLVRPWSCQSPCQPARETVHASVYVSPLHRRPGESLTADSGCM